ncbi:MAG: hypothetical protein H6978_15460 [Gammaproteobacteria bacterium]|nr:hypothetical protein [Gammaproteobacteria bacterium]
MYRHPTVIPLLLHSVMFALSLTGFAAAQTAADERDVQDAETIVVTGTKGSDTLRETITDFVAEVGDPPSANYGYARWNRNLCVSVASLPEDPAQYIVNRISEVAEGLGLGAREAGCAPNITVVFTNDGAKLASRLVETSPRAFRPYGGVGGTTQGLHALNEFATSAEPVRWWLLTMPVDRAGMVAVRLQDNSDQGAYPTIQGSNSRISHSVRDDLWGAYVIVDVSKVRQFNWTQIADYLAMVVLVQIDPAATPAGFDSILNLFDTTTPAAGLTEWDKSYLHAVYEMAQYRLPRTQKSELVSRMLRAQDAAADGE